MYAMPDGYLMPNEPDDVADARAAEEWSRTYMVLVAMLLKLSGETTTQDVLVLLMQAFVRLDWWTRRHQELRSLEAGPTSARASSCGDSRDRATQARFHSQIVWAQTANIIARSKRLAEEMAAGRARRAASRLPGAEGDALAQAASPTSLVVAGEAGVAGPGRRQASSRRCPRGLAPRRRSR